MEVVDDIERCTDLYLEPVHPDDLEKLVRNQNSQDLNVLSGNLLIRILL